ncbi:hypothetical protein Asera_18190 [Actinocatenispora sera]|uniref:Uncharacterized protein n=1 Tax=Actinocatenispora sera TaxID=390989 RepID=A0A810KZS0_9ACTN|nr:hypothetical protein Asera_18190 [Actinocatenispora sera]
MIVSTLTGVSRAVARTARTSCDMTAIVACPAARRNDPRRYRSAPGIAPPRAPLRPRSAPRGRYVVARDGAGGATSLARRTLARTDHAPARPGGLLPGRP